MISKYLHFFKSLLAENNWFSQVMPIAFLSDFFFLVLYTLFQTKPINTSER